MSVGEVLKSGAISQYLSEWYFHVCLTATVRRVAAQVGITSCLANSLLSCFY